MSEPLMQSPLHSFALKAQAPDGTKGVWANEIPLLGYISLRGLAKDAAFVDAVSGILGVGLPIVPCALASSPKVKVLWLSPDEWLIVCARSQLGTLIADLNRALAGMRCQVVDNSGGFTQVLLSGDRVRDVLGHVTVYDVPALALGRVVGTTFGKSSIYLHRAGNGYCLVFRRSFADYIWRYLTRAAMPYGFGIAKLDADGIGV